MACPECHDTGRIRIIGKFFSPCKQCGVSLTPNTFDTTACSVNEPSSFHPLRPEEMQVAFDRVHRPTSVELASLEAMIRFARCFRFSSQPTDVCVPVPTQLLEQLIYYVRRQEEED